MPGSSMLLKIKYTDSTAKCHSLPGAAFSFAESAGRGNVGGGGALGRVRVPRGSTEHGGLVLMELIPESKPSEVLSKRGSACVRVAPHGAGGFEKALGAKPPGGDGLGTHGSGSGPGSVQATQCQKRHIAALNSL